jgi:hypothetical protein
MDFIRPIGPVERDIEPLHRVERAEDDAPREEQQPKRREPDSQPAADSPQTEAPDGPVEGDDGHLHIDVRA